MTWADAFASISGGALALIAVVLFALQFEHCSSTREFRDCTKEQPIADCKEIYGR